MPTCRRSERWKLTNPQAPEGNWWKDFGSFKLCGTSELPKTILMSYMKPTARKSSSH